MARNGFTDIKEDRASFDIIQEFFDRGLTTGYPDGSFKPDQAVSRSEFICFVNRTFNFDITNELNAASLDFVDVKGTEWFFGDLHIAIGQNYIAGYPDGTFRANKSITRQEAAAILQRILNYELLDFTPMNEEMEPWAKKSIYIMISNGIIMPRQNGFEGSSEMTREEMAISLINILHKEEAKEDREEDKDIRLPTEDTSDIKPDKNIINPDTDVVYALNEAFAGLEKVLQQENDYSNKLKNHQLAIVQNVKSSIDKYLTNYSYDIELDKNQVKAQINILSKNEQEELKHAIQACVPLEYINTLQDFFDIN